MKKVVASRKSFGSKVDEQFVPSQVVSAHHRQQESGAKTESSR